MSQALSPEDRTRLEELFDAAAELPHDAHAEFVERECGSNAPLRIELSRLLSGLFANDFLSDLRPGAPTRAGTRIGRYELVERVGEGGMGEVYAADQLEPIARRVALKIIKPGMDSAQVVARFEAERQALARMAHPNIAQVYDGGATDDGRPYFVMEFVDGEAVTDYCDHHKLTTSERIELFLGICDGIQHAHQKGIIHRDLKPSNLLVAQQDGAAVPKIIDFGVARATTGRLGEQSMHTMLGQIVGTIDFMSPEQADPGGVDLDTRSDIYSLGVVLYKLLTGLMPFELHAELDQPFSQLQRMIREEDPPTPSTRLRRQRKTATTVAPLRSTNEQALIRQLTGDLDWICMRALEKDPARRYASASEFAEDLRRHLANLPVLAGRPSALYRALKFVRRHRVSVVGGALVLAGLIAGAGGIASGRLDALASEQRALALEPQADASRARRLVLQVDELWPPHPERIPALEKWLVEARATTNELDKYSAELDELRSRALPWTGEERARDRANAPGAEDLALAEAALTFWLSERGTVAANSPSEDGSYPFVDKRIEENQSTISQWLPEAEVRRTWSFDSELDRSAHQILQSLIDDLGTLGDGERGLLASDAIVPTHGWSVPRRLEFANGLEASFAEGGAYAALWRDALPKIRAAYPGLELEPQMGLVPLGPDPESGLWEFEHLQTRQWRFADLLAGAHTQRKDDASLNLTSETGIVLVLLPGGESWMGSQSKRPGGHNYYAPGLDSRVVVQTDGAEALALDDELLVAVMRAFIALSYDPGAAREANRGSAFKVDVEPFFMSKYEMTQAQWERATGENPSRFQEGLPLTPLNPVNQVSWSDCTRTLQPLGLALPHEEQWEYAARAGTETPWWTGTDETSLKGAANVLDITTPGPGSRGGVLMKLVFAVGFDDGANTIDEVMRRRANPFGLHDVSGNVTEWCSNLPYFYGTPETPHPSIRGLRNARGGSSRDPATLARSAARKPLGEGLKGSALGLRPMRAIER
jgi:serine/threonine protein kinase/formylglycine-generating enzyme required for sulfatase activity